MIRTTLLASALSLTLGAVAFAQKADFISPDIGFFEAGVLCALDSGVARDAPGTVAGTTHVVETTPPFVNTERRVPAVLGIGFGVLSGTVKNQLLEGVTMTVTHPPLPGNGTTSQSFTTTIAPSTDPRITFYQFDYGYELALGDWTLTTTMPDGTVLYKVTFTVVPPVQLPELAGACGYLDLLS